MSDLQINLSYIISTRNRLPFLKITLQRLIDNLQADEEIVVVDGNSTDGAKEYLQQQFEEKKIQQFISEPDKNQAHGWNKALLLAKGVIIKKIIDDDVFYYPAIRLCKDYLLQNAEIDIVISNDAGSALNDYKRIEKHSRLAEFDKWRNKLIPSFTFGDVHMLIRRRALAYIGLYSTEYVNMDWEYALRISYKQAGIAYYTGYNALTVAHAQTVTSLRDQKLIALQGKKGRLLYDYAGDAADISWWSKIKIAVGSVIYSNKRPDSQINSQDNIAELEIIYDSFYKSLFDLNQQSGFRFIT